MNTVERDSEVVSKLEKAWKCILAQYSSLVCAQYQSLGPGLAIFILYDRVAAGKNCEFFYAIKDSEVWKGMLKDIPHFDEVLKSYIPSEHVLITINIQPTFDADETIGEVKLFTYESLNLKEIVPTAKE